MAPMNVACTGMEDGLYEAVRGLRLAYPDLGVKPILAKLREQQPELGAATKEVRKALQALQAERALQAEQALQVEAWLRKLCCARTVSRSSPMRIKVAPSISQSRTPPRIVWRRSRRTLPIEVDWKEQDRLQHERIVWHARWFEEPSSQDAPVEIPVLPDDILAHIGKLANDPLEPRTTVHLSSASRRLRKLLTPELRQRLQEEHEAAAALCRKVGTSCKALREATKIEWRDKGLSVADLTTLGTLGSLLPALRELSLLEPSADPDGVQRLAEKLGAGALPGVTCLYLCMPVGDAGALAIAAALDRGALPRLERLALSDAAIGDAGLVALAPALRRRPALEALDLDGNPFGDEGLAALVAPPPADAPPPQAEVLAKLDLLSLKGTQITDDGCAQLASRLWSGALPALASNPDLELELYLEDIPASEAAIDAVYGPLFARLGLDPVTGW